MGLYLISSLVAHDFGYLSLDALLDRLEKTLDTFDKLERSHGHFYNWYDTRTLKGLPPIFLSTVDSGNLLGCLVALKQGLREKAAEPIPSPATREGLEDALDLVAEALRPLQGPDGAADSVAAMQKAVEEARGQLAEAPLDLIGWDDWLRRLDATATTLTERSAKLAQEIEEDPEELRRWVGAFASLVRERQKELEGLAPWLGLLRAVAPAEGGGAQPWRDLRALLAAPISVATVLARAKALQEQLTALARTWPNPDDRRRLDPIVEALADSTASDLDRRGRDLARRAQVFAEAMNFKMLYSEESNLFAVGYNLSQGRLETAHYDLLASEACLTSFLAVARGDVPKKHWFQLGRPLTRSAGAVALLSWGGTMFEYLMPRLLMPGVPETLLDESRKGAVARQIEYGRQCRVPWGVSESAFNVVDAALNYQYQAFGVPGLGLKRGLSRDLVVAPYACAWRS